MNLSELYEEFERELKRYATGLTRDGEWADDLVQDTFIRAMGHLALLGQLQSHQQRAWLRRTLKNLFLDELRSRRRQETALAQLGEPDEEELALSPAADFEEKVKLVPAHYRGLLQQHFVLGMSSEEIAHDLGVPPATVRSRLHLAVQWLRNHQAQLE